MTASTYILADADDIWKVLGAIVVLVVWGISALGNLAKKQQGQANQGREAMERAMREQMEAARRQQAAAALGQMGGPPPPPPLPVPAGRRHGPAVPPMRAKARTQQQQRNVPPVTVQRPPQAPRAPQAPRPRGPVVPPRRTKKAERRQQAAPAPLPFLEPEPEGGPGRPSVPQSEIGAGATAASPSRRRAAAGPMIRITPQSLRQQFILTEILQPPLALREGRGNADQG